MRSSPLLFALVLGAPALGVAVASAGCTVAHYPGYTGDDQVTHGTTDHTTTSDAYVAMIDGGPREGDAWVAPNDAWTRPGEDAWTRPPDDAWVAPTPDAWTMPSCPTYGGDVKPLYAAHCATCHTTGREVRFGSSYSVASQSSSGCGTTMTECTIQLGRPGGSMARRDPLGGFSASDIALIRAWADCGYPM